MHFFFNTLIVFINKKNQLSSFGVHRGHICRSRFFFFIQRYNINIKKIFSPITRKIVITLIIISNFFKLIDIFN